MPTCNVDRLLAGATCITGGLGLCFGSNIGLHVMVTNVVRTRLRDMEQPTNNDQQQHQQSTLTATDSILVDPTPESDEGFVKEVKA
ncbi:hypothetical protein Ddye_000853 [Dipteronia dyeriana]|uniref:Uncharacterized protein n=1 Tax=Dipteronia dyeriana TaxID=168575 RepID=A0AAD9XMG4_9ROSI|nr:hypothetical protein Ddye_000853 [Dipteronia dyeriana]